MEHDFWHGRWEVNQIGFHEEQPHDFLQEFFSELNLPQKGACLVPLCGKSNDLLFLAEQGYSVIGAELSPIAVESFFKENQLEATRIEGENGFRLENAEAKIQLYCGDFFSLTEKELNGVHSVYDRAALVALPPTMRKEYAQHLTQILPHGGKILLIVFEYNQEEMNGPPFCISEEEIQSLYAEAFDIRVLQDEDIMEKDEDYFREKGATWMREKVYLLTKV